MQVLAQLGGQNAGKVTGGEGFQSEGDEAVAVGDGGGPLLGGPAFVLEVGRGEQGDHRVGAFERLVHALDQVVPRAPVPDVQDDPVAGLLQVPADPLGPGPVGARVADEELLGVIGHPCPRP